MLVVGSPRAELSALIRGQPVGSVVAITEPRHAAVVGTAERVAPPVPPASVVAATEGSVLAGGAGRSRLRLPGLDYQHSLALTHKTVMQDTAARHGLPVVAFAPMADPAELVTIGRHLGWPVIVKPSMGAGTQHFAVVRTPHEAAQWSAEARAVDLSHIPSNPWHAELLTEGRRGNEIAAELGLAKSTVSWHIKRLGIKGSRDYVGRRAIVATPAERDFASVSCAT